MVNVIRNQKTRKCYAANQIVGGEQGVGGESQRRLLRASIVNFSDRESLAYTS